MSLKPLFLSCLFLSSICLLRADEPGVASFQRCTTLMARCDGKLGTLVNVKGRRGVVSVDGKEVVLSKEQVYLPFRAEKAAPGFIEVLDEDAHSAYVEKTLYKPSGVEQTMTTCTGNQYEAYLCSDSRIEDCYAVLLFVNAAFLNQEAGELRCTMVLNKVGTLEAGKKKLLRIIFHDLPVHAMNSRCSVLFFSRGLEVKSSRSQITDQILDSIETRQHALSVEKYVQVNKTQDKAVSVYQRTPLHLPKDLEKGQLPETVNAIFTVTDTGVVEAVEIEESVPFSLKRVLIQQVQAWLFYPKLEQGNPKAAVLRVPLALKP